MELKYIYGPVSSWRLGRSLGVDLISTKKKVCSFDCVYCQLGHTGGPSKERKVYVETGKVIEFCDPRVLDIINTACELNNFKPLYHSLYIYGIAEKPRK